MERDTPLTITSPLGGEGQGEGENTPSFQDTPLSETLCLKYKHRLLNIYILSYLCYIITGYG